MTTPQVPQWTVRRTRGVDRDATFEDHGQAMVYAAGAAEAERPAIVTSPDGTRHAVFRLDPAVELSARQAGAAWRLVVDHP